MGLPGESRPARFEPVTWPPDIAEPDEAPAEPERVPDEAPAEEPEREKVPA